MRGGYAAVGALFIGVGVAMAVAVTWVGGILMFAAGVLFLIAAVRA